MASEAIHGAFSFLSSLSTSFVRGIQWRASLLFDFGLRSACRSGMWIFDYKTPSLRSYFATPLTLNGRSALSPQLICKLMMWHRLFGSRESTMGSDV